jgi:hypothetical protein
MLAAVTLAVLAVAGQPGPAGAQAPVLNSDPRAVAAVRAAVASQMEADRNDRSNWIYDDHDVTPDHDQNELCAGSPQGEVCRVLRSHGQPLDTASQQAETERIAKYVNDPSAQARAHKNQAHDDVQATALLQMLPNAFLWTVASETPEILTLNYVPNPGFNPPDLESRVMSQMRGQLLIARNGDLIYALRGTLSQDVKIGLGFFARLYKGGTFDVERRDVGENHWEIVETHVHISGHALFFKTIGTLQDEVKSNWRPSPAKTLREAEEILHPQ